MFSEYGLRDVLFFMGIVEKDHDVTLHDRIKVRCFGFHPPYSSGEMDTDELPWATVVNGAQGATQGVPGNGEWVIGFFMDGRDAQHPVVLGTIPGQTLQAVAGSGLPNESAHVKPTNRSVAEYGKPPTKPERSGERIEETQALLQLAAAKTDVPTADGNSWDEFGIPSPPGPEKAVTFRSPYTDSFVSIAGAGSGTEYIILSHNEGSYVVIHPSGDITVKSFADRQDVTEGSSHEVVSGTKNLTVEGNSYNLKVDGDINFECRNFNHTVHGDYNLTVSGTWRNTAAQRLELASEAITLQSTAEHINLLSAQKIKMNAGDTISMVSASDMYLTSKAQFDIKSTGMLSIGTNDEMNLRASGQMAGDASHIYWNSGQSFMSNESPFDAVEAQSPKITNDESVKSEIRPQSRSFGGNGGIGSVDTVEV